MDRGHGSGFVVAGMGAQCRDGTVEAIFSGPPDPIADMLERCKTGPRHARVDAVVAHDRPEPADLPRAFEFRPTTE